MKWKRHTFSIWPEPKACDASVSMAVARPIKTLLALIWINIVARVPAARASFSKWPKKIMLVMAGPTCLCFHTSKNNMLNISIRGGKGKQEKTTFTCSSWKVVTPGWSFLYTFQRKLLYLQEKRAINGPGQRPSDFNLFKPCTVDFAAHKTRLFSCSKFLQLRLKRALSVYTKTRDDFVHIQQQEKYRMRYKKERKQKKWRKRRKGSIRRQFQRHL